MLPPDSWAGSAALGMFHRNDFASTPDDRYARQLRRGFRRLRFEPAVESEYRRALIETERLSAAICAGVGGCVWLAFALLDLHRISALGLWQQMDAAVWLWLGARWSVLVLLLGGALVIRNRRGDYGWLSWTMYTAMGVAIAFSSWIIHTKGGFAADSAQIVVVMAAFLPLGLTFRRALAAALVVAAVSIFVLLVLDAHYELAHRMQIAAMLLLAMPVTAMGGYLREYSQRRQFLLTAILDRQAHTDPLTGLANRRSLFAHAERVAQLAARDGCGVALAIIDVDHFKHFNDGYGHGAGDLALQRVAEALGADLRTPFDMAARLGGEEFCVLLYGVTPDAAQARFDALLGRVRQLAIPHAGSPAGFLTLSGGAAMLGPHGRFDVLADRADAALYRAKREGRDRLRWA
ncbi:diguanylate cyclase domain-containing protein [Sphingomonas sp. MS122]|uniref:GGDEF domain-containing protein n=1 Tax=Sphingomonas sp. MS122 TaxID=3412683 RepID=UPI003C2D52C0